MSCMKRWTASPCSAVGRADEEVVREVEPLGHLLEVDDVAVGQLAWRDALALGDLGDRLAVLVGAGEEEDLLAALAHVARDDVGGDRRVRVAEVGLGVDVVDRGRDVEAHRRGTIEVGSGPTTNRASTKSIFYLEWTAFEPRPKDRGSAFLMGEGSQPTN